MEGRIIDRPRFASKRLLLAARLMCWHQLRHTINPTTVYRGAAEKRSASMQQSVNFNKETVPSIIQFHPSTQAASKPKGTQVPAHSALSASPPAPLSSLSASASPVPVFNVAQVEARDSALLQLVLASTMRHTVAHLRRARLTHSQNLVALRC